MTLSQLARSIAPSPTLALNEEARILRERGEPVINMSIAHECHRSAISHKSTLSSTNKPAIP